MIYQIVLLSISLTTLTQISMAHHSLT